MSDAVFVAVGVACATAGCAAGRWSAVGAAAALWVLGVGIAAAAGAFDATAEDNSLGVFVFTAVPALLWVALVAVGVSIRRLHHRHEDKAAGPPPRRFARK